LPSRYYIFPSDKYNYLSIQTQQYTGVDMVDLVAGFVAWALQFIEVWGYLGLFIVEIIGSATIIFPAPAFAINFILGGTPGFNPWLVGIVAGAGATIGEITGYGVGRGGREVIEKKYKPWLDKTKRWMETHGDFLIITLFAATPLPHDVVGMLSGAVEYPLKKFMLATLIGKIIAGLALAWAGYYGISLFRGFFEIG
jgi:membrane protein YqaA with SNARE-associated domain